MGQRQRSDSPALHEHGEPHSRRAPRLKHLRSNRVCALAPKSLVPVITRLHAGSAGRVRPNAAVEHQGRRLLRHRGKRGRWRARRTKKKEGTGEFICLGSVRPLVLMVKFAAFFKPADPGVLEQIRGERREHKEMDKEIHAANAAQEAAAAAEAAQQVPPRPALALSLSLALSRYLLTLSPGAGGGGLPHAQPQAASTERRGSGGGAGGGDGGGCGAASGGGGGGGGGGGRG